MLDGTLRSCNSDTKSYCAARQCYNTKEIVSSLCVFFQCICIDCSWVLTTTENDDVTLTFLSLLESFLVALMKSLRPWRYSSYSSSVMSPFSTSTCGRWGSEVTHSGPGHRHDDKYTAGGQCLKLKPSGCTVWVGGAVCGLESSSVGMRIKTNLQGQRKLHSSSKG